MTMRPHLENSFILFPNLQLGDSSPSPLELVNLGRIDGGDAVGFGAQIEYLRVDFLHRIRQIIEEQLQRFRQPSVRAAHSASVQSLGAQSVGFRLQVVDDSSGFVEFALFSSQSFRRFGMRLFSRVQLLFRLSLAQDAHGSDVLRRKVELEPRYEIDFRLL